MPSSSTISDVAAPGKEALARTVVRVSWLSGSTMRRRDEMGAPVLVEDASDVSRSRWSNSLRSLRGTAWCRFRLSLCACRCRECWTTVKADVVEDDDASRRAAAVVGSLILGRFQSSPIIAIFQSLPPLLFKVPRMVLVGAGRATTACSSTWNALSYYAIIQQQSLIVGGCAEQQDRAFL